MSVRTMARVWESSQHSGTELLMLLAIADFADDDGNAYPSVGTLAAKCRMKPRNARYCLAALEATGELKVTVNAGPKGANRYRVMLNALGVQHSAGVQSVAGVQRIAATPAKDCREPLQRSAAKPSLNHQEPPEREQRSERSAPKSRICEDWHPSERVIAWARQKRPDLELSGVIEHFRDYHLAKGEARASWDASFRTWVARERTVAAVTGGLAPRRPTQQSGFEGTDYFEGTVRGPNGELRPA